MGGVKGASGELYHHSKVVKDATLADLRKPIEIHLDAEKQAFTFLALGDPKGAPVPREQEAAVQAARKLPISNQLGGYLACLRPVEGGIQQVPNHLPLNPLKIYLM